MTKCPFMFLLIIMHFFPFFVLSVKKKKKKKFLTFVDCLLQVLTESKEYSYISGLPKNTSTETFELKYTAGL